MSNISVVLMYQRWKVIKFIKEIKTWMTTDINESSIFGYWNGTRTRKVRVDNASSVV